MKKTVICSGAVCSRSMDLKGYWWVSLNTAHYHKSQQISYDTKEDPQCKMG